MRVLIIFGMLALPLWAPGPVTVCKSGCNYSDLQKAVDDAVAGWRIRPLAGETFTRNTPLMLDNDLTDWVTIESSRIAELKPGYRVFPQDADKMPKIVSSDPGNGSVIHTKTTAHHWRLVGLEISWAGPGQTNDGDLIWFGDTSKEIRADLTSHHFVVDRSYIHGWPDDQGPQRGVAANANYVTVSNSYISEIHLHSGNQESHIAGLFAAGEGWTLRNNSFIGGSEGTLTGGGRDPVNQRYPRDVRIIGNYYFMPGEYITYNFEADPEGNTPPTSRLIRTQTFLDLDGADNQTGTADDFTYLVWTEQAWRKIGQPLGINERRYYAGSLWRNQATGTVWKANAEGTRYVAGAADRMAPYLAKPITAVVPGNPTVLTLSYGCAELFQGNCSEGPARLMGAGMQFSGGENQWAALNGKKLHYTRVSSTQISIPFDSTGFPAAPGKLTGTPQFLWWPQKNGAEFKSGVNSRFEGNVIRNRWPITFGNQDGAGFLWNYLPDQDGPNVPLRDSVFINNKIIDTVCGVLSGRIQADYQIPDTKIITGNPTKLNIGGSMFMRAGEEVFLSQGTGDFADLAKPTGVAITKGHNEGLPSGEVWVAYDSTGKSTAGVKLRLYDSSHLKQTAWPRGIAIANNLFDIGSVPTMASTGLYQPVYDTGTVLQTSNNGLGFGLQAGTAVTHNTIIRRSYSPEVWPLYFAMGSLAAVHNRNSAPADVVPPVDMRIFDNLDDGSAGRFMSDQNSSDGCADQMAKFWGVNGSRAEMGGNVTGFAGVWQSGISAAEFNHPVCQKGFIWAWGREGGFATEESDGSVTVSAAKATFAWKAAARLLPGSVFCVTDSEPAALKGCYRAPKGVNETSTTWSNVELPGVADGTYKNVKVASGVRYLDYANRNYRLHPESPVRGLAHDGGDPGADLNVVDWSTEMVESGHPNPYLDTWITNIAVEDTAALVCFVAYDLQPASITVATSRKYEPDVGADTTLQQRGRQGCIKVAGLTPATHYYARLHTGGRYRDNFESGAIAEFTTRR